MSPFFMLVAVCLFGQLSGIVSSFGVILSCEILKDSATGATRVCGLFPRHGMTRALCMLQLSPWVEQAEPLSPIPRPPPLVPFVCGGVVFGPLWDRVF